MSQKLGRVESDNNLEFENNPRARKQVAGGVCCIGNSISESEKHATRKPSIATNALEASSNCE